MNNLKLLIKFPTRSRPEKFFNTLDRYYSLLTTESVEFIVSCDSDDYSMNNPDVISKMKNYKNLSFFFDNNKSKVEACNANISGKEFDIILLASDDMIPEIKGYDEIIKKVMFKYFPDMDGVLWFNDGFQQMNLNTLSILGKTYYDRFGYIYNPAYKSLYCDKEFTIVSRNLKKVIYIQDCIIRHKQHSIIKEKPDDLYIKNDSLESDDSKVFDIRALNNFQNG